MQSPERAGTSQGSGQSKREPEEPIVAADPPSANASVGPARQTQEQAVGQPSSAATAEPVSDFVYPPPPAFYERLSPEVERHSAQVQSGAAAPRGEQARPVAVDDRPAVPASPSSLPPRTAAEAPHRRKAAPSASPYPGWSQGAAPVAAAQRRSRRVVWISLGILALAFFACIGVAIWTFTGPFKQLQQQYDGLTALVNDYYDDIQLQDYVRAFRDLQPGGFHSQLTQQEFVQEAHDFDTRYGPVLSYRIRSLPNLGLENGPDYTVEVDVTRTHLSYTVLLTVRQVGNGWKIIDFDRL
ncbi:hypothetical protein [Thermogemmatispora tikiterensis]|uniref:DUF4878 domain-containing protein n=1 Tax=Thermogemmatispora tikiterensis TaxID=1825093 RepID=A0A328VQ76_9CHLR|nr:hypothetical protein [Thermogemmatispora tikiterensis]RAQ96275.1 hypothetical protein A4R35_12085 [Thermogemmatispora tikiterensis]